MTTIFSFLAFGSIFNFVKITPEIEIPSFVYFQSRVNLMEAAIYFFFLILYWNNHFYIYLEQILLLRLVVCRVTLSRSRVTPISLSKLFPHVFMDNSVRKFMFHGHITKFSPYIILNHIFNTRKFVFSC